MLPVIEIGYHKYVLTSETREVNAAAVVDAIAHLREVSQDTVDGEKYWTKGEMVEVSLTYLSMDAFRKPPQKAIDNERVKKAEQRQQWAENSKADLQKRVDELECLVKALKAEESDTD
jgi:hypothetical protein